MMWEFNNWHPNNILEYFGIELSLTVCKVMSFDSYVQNNNVLKLEILLLDEPLEI